ncbi:cold shock domain-containing protein [Nocardia sp. NPDC046473]|uniref:cold-shock protein n=1 Tax=Nocardia sp. NPDC046473 TaxID=3155733 RepID=UPI003411D4CC
MSSTGRVLRFDEAKGYGFIVSDSDDDDVFFHVNNLLIDQSVVQPGLRVVFEARNGDRGLYAMNIAGSVEGAESRANEVFAVDTRRSAEARLCDAREALLAEFTELIIVAAPDVNGHEIARIRSGFIGLVEKHGWLTAGEGRQMPTGSPDADRLEIGQEC